MWSIVGDLLPLDHNTTVLEPACGTGVFIRTAPAVIPHVNIAAIECEGFAREVVLTGVLPLLRDTFQPCAESIQIGQGAVR